MKSVTQFNSRSLRVLLTDIDGTLTQSGRLPSRSYASLWQLTQSGLQLIPVTGRPAGWCELIARLWPVHGVVGENGGLYFRLAGKKMQRRFEVPAAERRKNREKLRVVAREVLAEVPGCRIASDQFSRLLDLAIDFAEDVPALPEADIEKIASIFHRHGAQAKVSNIHVNGWFGEYDKLSTCRIYLQKEFGFTEKQMREHCAFVGDSPNDEPMFEFFPNSFAVANIKNFWSRLKHKPAYVAAQEEGDGFSEIADRLLVLQVR